MITLKAQNLTNLVNKSFVVIDKDLDAAQQKHLYKVMKDSFLRHEAKSIVKIHASTKDACAIWEQVCKTHDKSIATSMNADAILAYVAGVQLHLCNWNKSQGKLVTHCKTQMNKFNKMCPESRISDEQSVQMSQNVVSGTPNLANVLNLYRELRKAAGHSIKINFDEHVAFLPNKPKCVTTHMCLRVVTVAAVPLCMILLKKDKNMRPTLMTLMRKEKLKLSSATFGKPM